MKQINWNTYEEEFMNTPVSEMNFDDVDMTSWNKPLTDAEEEQAIAEFDAMYFGK